MSAHFQLLSFLSSTPANVSTSPHVCSIHLPTTPLHTEPVSRVYHSSRYFITGTDIIRALLFRFRVLNIPIASLKKFEEGVFSDLRNLKVGVGCQLEEPRSPFLVQLHELGCIRTQKKQKVFFWESVDHEHLFKEAVGREKKRMGQSHDGFNMIYSEWKSMSGVWESTLPLKITVHNLAMPTLSVNTSSSNEHQHNHQHHPSSLLYQSPMLSSSSNSVVRSAPAGRKLMANHNRSRASSSGSSSTFMAANLFGSSYPSTPKMLPASARPLPLSMFHLLNQSNDNVCGMPTPDNRFKGGENEDPLLTQWNDEAIAAVTLEVLSNAGGSDLFNEADPMISDYTNWLVSDGELSNTGSHIHTHSASSVLSALSLIENPDAVNEHMSNGYNSADMAALLSTMTSPESNGSCMVQQQQDIELAAADLLFASMINTDSTITTTRKRSRSNTGSSMSSVKSSKRFQPYQLPCQVMLYEDGKVEMKIMT